MPDTNDDATRFLEIEGRRIAHDDTGATARCPPACPACAMSGRNTTICGRPLRENGFRVVTMEIRGGETDAMWQDYSARAVGGDALALIDHLDAAFSASTEPS